MLCDARRCVKANRGGKLTIFGIVIIDYDQLPYHDRQRLSRRQYRHDQLGKSQGDAANRYEKP
jgi:hypothetical protein